MLFFIKNLLSLVVICLAFQLSAQHKFVYPYEFEKQFGLVSENEKITAPIFDRLDLFKNQRINQFTIIKKKDAEGKLLSGIIDKTGKVILEPKYENLQFEGKSCLAFVKENDLLKVFNLKTGQQIYEYENGKVHEVKGNHKFNFVVIKNKTTKAMTLVDQTGKPFAHNFVGMIQMLDYPGKDCPLIHLRKNPGLPDRDTYMDCNGAFITWENYVKDIPEMVDMDLTMDEEVFDQVFKTDQEYLDLVELENEGIEATEVIKSPYDPIYIGIEKDGRKGLANLKGEILLAPEYLIVYFAGGMDFVIMKNEKGYGIYRKNRTLVEPQFDVINFDAKQNLFFGTHPSGYSGVIDGTGKIQLPKECNCLN